VDRHAVREAILAQPTARLIVHLGDGERDVENLVGMSDMVRVVQVRGNADFGSLSPSAVTELVEGKRVLCVHGYAQNVRYGASGLLDAARDANADLVLFGHTHEQRVDCVDGLWLLNPGCLRHGEYAVADVNANGIVCLPMRLP
jgi:putative phosphoesterase